MKSVKSLICKLAAVAAFVVGAGFAVPANAIPVVPNAAGHGVETPAGRGGTVIKVTNLNYDGAGSLKACTDARGPRVCVFEVSGTITLSDDLTLRNRYITIAGQTAPSPGITLRGAGLLVKTSDVLVQHLRFRPGDSSGGEPPGNRDALKIEAPAEAPINNIVIDHCTFTWSVDEIASAWQYWNNISLLNNIFAEPLNESIHPEGKHGFGVLIGPVSGNATIAGNLIASMESRLPMTAASRTVIVNNLMYNWGNTVIDLQSRGLVTQNSVVGNVFVRGPNSSTKPVIGLRADSATLRSGAKVYIADNIGPGATSAASDPWSLAGAIYGSLNLSNYRSTSPLAWPNGLTAARATTVRENVLKFSGARPADRDSVDRRIIDSTRNATGRIINCVAANGSTRCQANAGGWPTLAQNRRTLTIPSNPNTVTSSGYTNLELWLHKMSAEVEGRSGGTTTVTPRPPSQLTIQ